MTATMGGLFDEALQKTDVWLGGVASRLGDGDRRRAYLALRSTLHALRDRLLPQEAVQLGAQLPLIVRGFYYEGWRPTETPRKERHAEQFLARIRHEFRNEPEVEAGAVARAVFGVLAEHVTAGEIDDVKHLLPAGVRDLWP